MSSISLPQPDQIPKKEREDAMSAYLMMFAAWAVGLPFPFINLIAAVVFYLLNRRKSNFVAFHAYQSMISQIIISLLNGFFIGWLIYLAVQTELSSGKANWEYFIIYALFVILWNLIYTGISIYACVQAYKGRFYYMLLFGKLAFKKFYGPHATHEEKVFENKPPTGFEK